MNAPAAHLAITSAQPVAEAPPVSHDNLRLSARLVALVTPFMAAKDIRYYLCGVNVRPHPDGGAVICATNGHVLGAVHDKDAVCDHEVILVISTNTVVALKARGDGGRFLAMRHGRLAVLEGEREVSIQPGDPVLVGKYPQYQNVIPPLSSLKPGMVGQFNTAYIALLDRVAKIACRQVGPLQSVTFYNVTGNPRSSAIARLSAEPNFVAVLMSQSPDDLVVLPDWCAGIKPKDDLAAAQVSP